MVKKDGLSIDYSVSFLVTVAPVSYNKKKDAFRSFIKQWQGQGSRAMEP